jgi:hypothetical protein
MQSKLLALLQPDDESRPQQALSQDVIFHSPVRDYHGRADVAHILSMVGVVLGQIRAQRELAVDHKIVTLVTASHRHEPMKGVLYETHDAAGAVDRAALLIGPRSTLRRAITDVVAALAQSPLPSMTDAESRRREAEPRPDGA